MIYTEGDDGDEQRRDIFDTRANSAGTNAYSLNKWTTQKHCFWLFYVIAVYVCVCVCV